MDGFTKKYFHTIQAHTEDTDSPRVCPFCGSRDVKLQQYLKTYFYRCDHCGASVEKSVQDSPEKALFSWNLRVGSNEYIGKTGE